MPAVFEVAEAIWAPVAAGFVPVVSPWCHGSDEVLLNISLTQAAGSDRGQLRR